MVDKISSVSIDAIVLSVIASIVAGPMGIAFLLLSYAAIIDAVMAIISLPGRIANTALETIKAPFRLIIGEKEARAKHRLIRQGLIAQELQMHPRLIALAGSWDNVARPIQGARSDQPLPESLEALVTQRAGPYITK